MRYFIVGVAAGSKPFISATNLLGVEHPTFPSHKWLLGYAKTKCEEFMKASSTSESTYFTICSISEVSKEDYRTFIFGPSDVKPEEKTYTAQEVRELLKQQRELSAKVATNEEPSGRVWDAIIDAPLVLL